MNLKTNPELKKHIWPLKPEEFEQLEQNILAEGIRDKIITWQGFIVDGHNRYEIAIKHSLPFETIEHEFENIEDVKDWMDANQIGRRNLTKDQWEISIGRRYNREKKQGKRTDLTYGQFDHKLQTSEKLADEYKVSPATVRRYAQKAKEFERLETEKPDVFEQVKAGNKTFTEVKKEEKIEARKAEIEAIKQKIESEPMAVDGLFDVVVIDPPWAYEEKGGFSNEQHDPTGNRGGIDYPSMTVQQISEINLPVTENAVVFLWTTHAFLRDSFDLLDKWGLKYKATLVWDKEIMGMGRTIRLQCEFCLLATKGKPVIQGSGERDIIREKRREHSRKPEAFYSLVDRMCIGRKLDYFSREQRKNWYSYGAETGKF